MTTTTQRGQSPRPGGCGKGRENNLMRLYATSLAVLVYFIFSAHSTGATDIPPIASVASIAQMEALGAASAQTPAVYVQDYGNGIGGGGTFLWNPSSTQTADHCNVFAASGVTTGRWIRSANDSTLQVTPAQCGAHGDGTNSGGGTDDGPAFNYAIAVLNQSTYQAGTLFIPCQSPTGTQLQYLITTGINDTGGYARRTQGGCGRNLSGGGISINPLLICNTGTTYACWDWTGSNNSIARDISLGYPSAGTPSCIGILMARSSSVGGEFAQHNDTDHLAIRMKSNFTGCPLGRSIGIYNYASEVDSWIAPQIDADNPIFLTSSNAGTITSEYTTIETGSWSMTQLTVLHGDLDDSDTGTASAVVTIEGNSGDIDLTDSYANGNAKASAVLLPRNATLDGFNWWGGRFEGTNYQTAYPIMLGSGSKINNGKMRVALGQQGNFPALGFDVGGTLCPQISNSDIQITNEGPGAVSTSLTAESGSATCTGAMLLDDVIPFENNGYQKLILPDGSPDTKLQLAGSISGSNIIIPGGSSYSLPDSFGDYPPTTTLTGTNGTAECSQSRQGILKITTCYLNEYAEKGPTQTYRYPTAFSTYPTLVEGGRGANTCGRDNPSTTASVLSLPASLGMTAETCSITAIGQ